MINVTQDQIDDWKSKFGDVFKLTVGDKVCYLKPIGREVLSKAGLFAQDNVKMCEFILESCWLEGDNDIKHIDSYFLNALDKISALRDEKESSLEKL